MAKLAFITDVHADVHALRDALAQITKLGITQVVCCGDLIDYGLFPDETLAVLRERGVIAIRGNHDRWAIERSWMSSSSDLADGSVAFLESLPTHWRQLIDDARVVVAHARPGSDMDGISADLPDDELEEILDMAGADVLVVGHTHVPFVRRLSEGRIVANPGALLRDPAPGVDVPKGGTFAVLDVATRELVIRRALDGAPV